MSFFERYLQKTSQSIAVLPEILQVFTAEATRMIGVTGRVDSAAVAASIATVSKSFGLTGMPLQTVFGAMNQGLQQSNNPAVQAMQFAAMERAMPGASLWQMQMAMENPMQNPQYVKNMLDLARKTSAGGREGYARNIQQLLGVSANMADILSRKEYSPEMWAEEAVAFEKTGLGGFRKRAEGLTGATEVVAATVQGGWERTGFNSAQELAARLKDLLEGIGGVIDDMNKNREFVKDVAEKNLNAAYTTSKGIERLIRIIESSGMYWSTSPAGH
jgi:hypothetical protein